MIRMLVNKFTKRGEKEEARDERHDVEEHQREMLRARLKAIEVSLPAIAFDQVTGKDVGHNQFERVERRQ